MGGRLDGDPGLRDLCFPRAQDDTPGWRSRRYARLVVSLSVIVPTVGRESLAGTLASVVGQLEPEDRVVVVGDGCQPAARRLCRALAGVGYAEVTDPASVYGNRQRDLGMELATGSHLLFIDDDDCHEPDALAVVRAAVEREPGRARIFRARWGPGHHAAGVVLWRDPVVREQNIATPMVVLPRRRYRVGWLRAQLAARHPTVSDFVFLAGAIAETGGAVFHEDVIATVRP